MKLVDLYAEYFANWISGGNLINQDKISLLGMKPMYDRFVTHKSINKVWFIYSFPVNLSVNISDIIRQEMFATCPSVRTVVHTYNVPVNMNVNNEVFRRQLKRSEESYENYRSIFDKLSSGQKLMGYSEIDPETGRKIYINQKTLDKVKEQYDSYTYVCSSAMKGMTFTHTYFFIQASARTKRDMKMYKKELMNLLNSLDVYYKEVYGNIGKYLDNFCPGTYIKDEVKEFSPMLFSNENLVSQLPYKTKGLIGGSGLLLGMDAQTKLPFMVDFFNSGSAQVALLLAKSGHGKTYMAFQIALFLIALDIHCSAIDIKGNEWSKLLQFTDGLIIGMDDRNSRFVNTLRLDDIDCKEHEARDYFMTALKGTITLFSIITNLQPNEGNRADLEMILEQAIMKYYYQHNVFPDKKHTFKNTKGMKYAGILDVINELSVTKSFSDDQRRICNLIRTRAANYFTTDGRYNEAFRNEITVGEILETPLVIYSFNKNDQSMLDTLDTLRVFMAQFLDTKKQSIRKSQRKHTAAFYEELQRSDQFGMLIETISHAVTGSRSNNVMIFLLMNAISCFNNKELDAIKSNITTMIVGKINSGDIETLVNKYDCKHIEDLLKLINKPDTNRWNNCFVVSYDTGIEKDRGICKTVIPNEFVKCFATRDKLNEE